MVFISTNSNLCRISTQFTLNNMKDFEVPSLILSPTNLYSAPFQTAVGDNDAPCFAGVCTSKDI